jgi:hypothetical protein
VGDAGDVQKSILIGAFLPTHAPTRSLGAGVGVTFQLASFGKHIASFDGIPIVVV